MYIHRKPKNAEFESDIEIVAPSFQEVDFFASQNTKCHYYYLGLAKCRDSLIKGVGQSPYDEKHKYGFLPCKKIEDGVWRCLTNKKNGRILSTRRFR